MWRDRAGSRYTCDMCQAQHRTIESTPCPRPFSPADIIVNIVLLCFAGFRVPLSAPADSTNTLVVVGRFCMISQVNLQYGALHRLNVPPLGCGLEWERTSVPRHWYGCQALNHIEAKEGESYSCMRERGRYIYAFNAQQGSTTQSIVYRLW